MKSNHNISYLIKKVPIYLQCLSTEEENLIRVYSEEDRDKALEKIKAYYDKYSDYNIVVEEEGNEKFEYNDLEELLKEDWL